MPLPGLNLNQERHFYGILSLYTQRWMEPLYDRFFVTATGRWLLERNRLEKRVIEALMYGAAKFAKTRLGSNPLYLDYLKDILTDMAPEIAHRMIHGQKPSFTYGGNEPYNRPVFERAIVAYSRGSTTDQSVSRDTAIKGMGWSQSLQNLTDRIRTKQEELRHQRLGRVR